MLRALAASIPPWLWDRHHGGRVAHPLLSLLVLAALLALIAWAFSRRAS